MGQRRRRPDLRLGDQARQDHQPVGLALRGALAQRQAAGPLDRLMLLASTIGSGPWYHGVPPTGATHDPTVFKVGQEVEHTRWGRGTIVEIARSNFGLEATVHFPEVGEKRLDLSMAPLKPIP